MKPTNRNVLACGVFDLLHIGHLRYLQYASQCGDSLTVAVSADSISLNIKGKSPVIPEKQRVELIQGLGCVDSAKIYHISLEQTEQAAQWIYDWGINHVVGGGDWLDSERWKRLIPALDAKGITVEFAPRTEEISTSGIIDTIRLRSESDNLI